MIKCSQGVGLIYTLLYILALVMVGLVIQGGVSQNIKISWTLYSFAIFVGLVNIALLLRVKCSSESRRKMFRYTLPILTAIMTILNMVAMLISKPSVQVAQLYFSHTVNILLLIVSVIAGISVCNSICYSENKPASNRYQSRSGSENKDEGDNEEWNN